MRQDISACPVYLLKLCRRSAHSVTRQLAIRGRAMPHVTPLKDFWEARDEFAVLRSIPQMLTLHTACGEMRGSRVVQVQIGIQLGRDAKNEKASFSKMRSPIQRGQGKLTCNMSHKILDEKQHWAQASKAPRYPVWFTWERSQGAADSLHRWG